MAKKLLLSFVLLISTNTLCFAANEQSLSELRQIATNFLQTEVGSSELGEVKIQLGRLDPRLRLAPCRADLLEAYLPSGTNAQNANIVGVRCEDSKPWSIYIPVRIAVMAKVLVAKQTLVRGTRINSSMVDLAEQDINRLNHGYFQQTQDLVGKVTKRPIKAGSPLTPYDIKSAKVVKRGEQVHIRVQGQGINVSMSGVALEGGTLGQIIKVRNLGSKRVIEAQVVGQQRVLVTI